MKKIGFAFLLLTLSCALFGQNEASHWYFGQNAGLRFDATTGTVTGITDGQINTLEGCTSISDANGDLLFYSDGSTVWNRNHQQMPNGFGLKAQNSSTQGALIVHHPDNDSLYYILTVPSDLAGGVPAPTGCNMSVVNMNLEGGLGDIITKNIELNILTPVGIAITIVIIPKKALTLALAPIVKKWCNHTENDKTVITTLAQTIVAYPKSRFLANTETTSENTPKAGKTKI